MTVPPCLSPGVPRVFPTFLNSDQITSPGGGRPLPSGGVTPSPSGCRRGQTRRR